MSTSDDDQIARLAAALGAYDEARSEGKTSIPLDDGAETLTPQELDDLHKARSLLDLLYKAAGMQLRGATVGDNPAAEGSRRFGRFELKKELGSGGFGVVYLAYDPVVRRDVALKTPGARVFLNEDVRRRCLREAEAAGRLNHPNIVRVLEAGEIDSCVYVAFECIDGPTLARWMRDRTEPVGVRMAALLIARLAGALGQAHERGVLHRDVKPGNVLLDVASSADPDLPFEPKLTDFGLARLVDAIQDETKTGAILGTPKYIAPEQAAGSHRKVGAPADVYSLGTILYELLAGRTPFVGETEFSTYQQVIQADPVRLRRLRPSVPVDLETICMKCLQKDPAARYATGVELAEDLLRFLEGKPIKARPTPAWKRTILWVRRRPAAATIVGLLFFFIVAAAIGSWMHEWSLRSQRDQLQEQNLQLRRHQYAIDLRRAELFWEAGNLVDAQSVLDKYIPRDGDVDLRGFDWRYLHSRATLQDNALVGHDGDVYHIDFSPTGGLLVSAGKDRTVRLWDCRGRRQIRTLRGHQGEVNWAAFSPDGQSVVTASDDGTAAVWNVGDGVQRAVYRGHGTEVVVALFTPDGRRVVSAGKGAALHVWDPSDGKKISEHPSRIDRVDSMAIRPQGAGSQLAAVGQMRPGEPLAAELWSLADPGAPPRVIPLAKPPVYAVAYSWDGKALYTAGEEIRRVYPSIGVLADLKDDMSFSIAASPDGRMLATGGLRLVQLHSARDGKLIWSVRGHTRRIWSVQFDAVGKTLGTASEDGTIRLWPVEETDGCLHVPIKTLAASHVPGFVSPRLLRAADALYCVADDEVWRIDVEQGLKSKVLTFGLPQNAGYSLCTSSRRRVLAASVTGKNGYEVWDLETGRRLTFVPFPDVNPEDRLAALGRPVLSPDASLLMGPYARERFGVWSLPDGKLLQSLPKSDVDQFIGSFSPDGAFAVVSVGGERTFLETPSFRTLTAQLAMGAWLNFGDFSSDGRLYYCGSGDSVWLYDVGKWTRPRVVIHRYGMRQMALSPDNRTLATSHDGGRVRLWSVDTAESTTTLKIPAGEVTALMFTPDGCTLAAFVEQDAGRRMEVLLWKGDQNIDATPLDR